jgi:arylsulfatase A-like enzyme
MKTYLYPTLLLSGLCFLAGSCNAPNNEDKRVNIIYITADDFGYADLSSYGRKDYETPVLDAFIKEGLKFTNAYAAAPVCTPTRVALMTGKYPARNEVGLMEPLRMTHYDINMGLSPGIPTVSSILKANGYETALYGKWHLGFKPEFFPNKHGFDHFFGITAGAADYIDHKYFENQHILFENNKPVEKTGYLTDLITDYAVNFIKKEHTKPFFISLQYTAPHWPWQGPGDDAYPDSVGFRSGGSPETYARMVINMDTNIGRVLKAVKEAGLYESTLIIFTSDNGGERYSDMGPFKGSKMDLWEGGIRVPAAARWPGVIEKNRESNQPVITMDWTVTMLDAAGIKIPDSLSFDGISLLSHLKENSPVIPRNFYWRTSNEQRADAYRSGDWKYLKTDEGEFLFNLSEDPYETNNLKEKEPEKFRQIKEEFLSMDKQMLEPFFFPKNNED